MKLNILLLLSATTIFAFSETLIEGASSLSTITQQSGTPLIHYPNNGFVNSDLELVDSYRETLTLTSKETLVVQFGDNDIYNEVSKNWKIKASVDLDTQRDNLNFTANTVIRKTSITEKEIPNIMTYDPETETSVPATALTSEASIVTALKSLNTRLRVQGEGTHGYVSIYNPNDSSITLKLRISGR